MYSFQTQNTRRRGRGAARLSLIIIILLLIVLGVLTYAFLKAQNTAGNVNAALQARVISEAGSAQEAAYRLTQSSGTNSMTYLSNCRAHIYAMECLNQLSTSINGPGAILVDEARLSSCEDIITECELRIQAGRVLTDQYTALKDAITAIASDFSSEI